MKKAPLPPKEGTHFFEKILRFFLKWTSLALGDPQTFSPNQKFKNSKSGARARARARLFSRLRNFAGGLAKVSLSEAIRLRFCWFPKEDGRKTTGRGKATSWSQFSKHRKEEVEKKRKRAPTRPMRCKADEYRRRQDKLNLENPSKRKIFAKKSPNVPRRPRIWLNFISVKLPRPPRTWALPVIFAQNCVFWTFKNSKNICKNEHN